MSGATRLPSAGPTNKAQFKADVRAQFEREYGRARLRFGHVWSGRIGGTRGMTVTVTATHRRGLVKSTRQYKATYFEAGHGRRAAIIVRPR